MKESRTPKRILSKRKRRLLELQVREYIERYHPEFGDVAIDIRSGGTIATVRNVPAADHEQ